MDRPTKEKMARMPLAEAVLLLFGLIANQQEMQVLWQRHRGRCYERLISFDLMVQLISDALLKCDGSGRQAFRRHAQDDSLKASIQAAYGKLRRLPLALSEAFLQESTARLRAAFPEWSEYQLPKSLQAFDVITLDGKALKRVAKRLKATRGVSGGLLGGRALVALHWSTGLAVAMRTHEDGEANDVKFVKDLVPTIQQQFASAILWVGDRAFCDLTQPRHFNSRPGDHFLVRYHSKTNFYRDTTVKLRHGKTSEGQSFVESWGYLGAQSNRHRRYVRRIEIKRPGQDSIVLITDLLDADQYPAEDLIWMYRQRWDIEKVFQQVTEVFHLNQLIGSSAKASVFQFSFCLLLYNMIQVIRGYIAEDADVEPDEISSELLYRDVETQLKCWDLMIERSETVDYFSELPNIESIQQRLRDLLTNRWTELWRKSSSPGRQYSVPGKRKKSHGSVYRLEQAYRKRKQRRRSAKPKAPT